ncbi:unnamed protein product [Rotaria sp. Silwood1]|nr:unnamed protein product [Rotaria sp. Silwood1]
MIPIYITIETQIKIVFLNGLNVIRCSDNEIQVYKLPYYTSTSFKSIITCSTKDVVYSKKYTSFKWGKLKLICSFYNSQVREEQVVTKSKNGDIKDIPPVKGQLGQSTASYELEIKSSLISDTKIVSSKQPANNAYFDENTIPKERRIYIWFPGHPIICRIVFTGEDDNPCPSMDNQEVDDVSYACYYNPGGDEEPTTAQMEAELKQIEETDDKPNTDALKYGMSSLNCIVTFQANNSIDSAEIPDGSETSDDETNNQINNSTDDNNSRPSNSTNSNEDSDILKIIGSVLGTLLLIGLIGGVGYFLIRKYYFNKSSSSSSLENIDNGNKDSYSLNPKESQQSLAVTSAYETNTEVSMNVPPQEENPSVNLYPPDENKRQRTDTSMMFDEDM